MTVSYLDIMFADPTYVLLPPCNRDPIPRPLFEKIIICLSTRFDLPVKNIRPHLRIASLRQYGKVRCLDGGDVMNASALVAVGDDRRDATFIRVGYFFKHICHNLRSLLLLV